MALTPEERSAINRQNAQKSTGPRTPEGKARSRMNAFRHGLSGQFLILHPEDRDAYIAHSEATIFANRPFGPVEETLNQLLTDTTWLLHHANAVELNARAFGAVSLGDRQSADGDPAPFDALSVTAADHFQNCHSIPSDKGPASTPAGKNSIEWIGRHRYRLERFFFKLRSELKTAQKERRASAAQLRIAKEEHGDNFNPAVHGPSADDEFDPFTSNALALCRSRFGKSLRDVSEISDQIVALEQTRGKTPTGGVLEIRWVDPLWAPEDNDDDDGDGPGSSSWLDTPDSAASSTSGHRRKPAAAIKPDSSGLIALTHPRPWNRSQRKVKNEASTSVAAPQATAPEPTAPLVPASPASRARRSSSRKSRYAGKSGASSFESHLSSFQRLLFTAVFGNSARRRYRSAGSLFQTRPRP